MLVVNRQTSLYCFDDLLWADGTENGARMRMGTIRRFSQSNYRGQRIELTIPVGEFFAAASIACDRNNSTSKILKLAAHVKSLSHGGTRSRCYQMFCHMALSAGIKGVIEAQRKRPPPTVRPGCQGQRKNTDYVNLKWVEARETVVLED
jgi:hypothetical protein